MAEGLRASWLGLPGVPREAETIVLDRDLRLVALTGARYHAQMISNRLSIEAMRRARDAGLAATCGVSINHVTPERAGRRRLPHLPQAQPAACGARTSGWLWSRR